MKEPKIGDYLNYKPYGLITVFERGIYHRGTGNPSSKYSICKNEMGEIIKNSNGHVAWFYDELLTEQHFKINTTK